MAEKSVVFHYPSSFDSVFGVIRNTKSKPGGVLWLSASIFHPTKHKNDKLLILFNKEIIKLLQKCGPIKPGNILIFKKQTFLATVKPNDDYIVFELYFNNKQIPNDLNMEYISDPLNIFERKKSYHIKNQEQYELNNIYENKIINKYLEFNDQINYKQFYKNQQKKSNKKKRKNIEFGVRPIPIKLPPTCTTRSRRKSNKKKRKKKYKQIHKKFKRRKNKNHNNDIKKVKKAQIPKRVCIDLTRQSPSPLSPPSPPSKAQKLNFKIKQILTTSEYRTFVKTIKTYLKKSKNIQQFEQNIMKPFAKLFGDEKRFYLLPLLIIIIPRVYRPYYEQRLQQIKNELSKLYNNEPFIINGIELERIPPVTIGMRLRWRLIEFNNRNFKRVFSDGPIDSLSQYAPIEFKQLQYFDMPARKIITYGDKIINIIKEYLHDNKIISPFAPFLRQNVTNQAPPRILGAIACKHCGVLFYESIIDKHESGCDVTIVAQRIEVGIDKKRLEWKTKQCIFECSQCQESFKDQQVLFEHERQHNKQRKEPYNYKCGHCEYNDLCKKTFKTHNISQHNESQPFQCGRCKKRFKRSNTYQNHIKRVHWKKFDHQCGGCGKAFASKSTLKVHINGVHLKIKPFKCTELGCGKAFATKGSLTIHINGVHKKIKPFECEFGCGISFAMRSSLKIHHRVHTGEKPFACIHCGKKFSCSSGRNRHQTTHCIN